MFDWQQHERLAFFGNNNVQPTRISDMCYVNAHADALLLTATDDGVVRVWQDITDDGNASIRTAWRAFADVLPLHHKVHIARGGQGRCWPGSQGAAEAWALYMH